jgi:subtilisin family serine protease
MSIGKYYSPGKKWIDDAVQYAEQHDVLLIKAAGNESTNLDSVPNFPNPDYLNSKRKAGNFIVVGATRGGPDNVLVAEYSNYGSTKVDLFAPGESIYSTMPGNHYESGGGTSAAAPVVAGIAALVMEYYPSLSARQVKFVIEHSVMELPGLIIRVPGTNTKAEFASLSKSHGIVNAFKALKMAATLKGERK